jgi:uncharacterized membrane protein
MNYYNLSDFDPISIESLISRFQSRQTIICGSISIFGDSIGKPGENIYTLISIHKNENESVIFEFKNDRIIVFRPIFIVSNEKLIGVKQAYRIEWINNDLHLIYNNRNGIVENTLRIGSHIFRTKESQDAFMFYTW